MHALHDRRYLHGEWRDRLRHISYFLSPVTRPCFADGSLELVPNNFSEVPQLLSLRCRDPLVIASASTPDRHGYFPLGTGADYTASFIGRAPFYVEANRQMPRTFGRNQLHVSQVVGWCEADYPLVEIDPAESAHATPGRPMTPPGDDPPLDLLTFGAALLEAAPAGTIVVDDVGRIVLVNSQAEAIFGYPRAELLGRPVEVLVSEELHDLHRVHRHQFLRRRQLRPMGVGLQLFGRHRDGHEVPIEISLSPWAVGEDLFTIAAVRDVTAQRQLQAERDQIAVALDASVDGVYLLDEALVIRYANRGATLQTGYSLDELIGTYFGALAPRNDDDASFDELVTVLRDGQQDRVTVSTRLARDDGRIIDVEAIVQQIPDRRYATYLGLIRDISTRVESERTLRRANEALLLADDRERIARDLHDTVIQRLFASGLTLQSSLSLPAEASHRRVEEVIESIDTTITELRHAIFSLNRHATAPNTFERELHKVLHDAKRALGFPPALTLTIDRPMSAAIAADVLAVLREALANVARHARPTEVAVAVSCMDEARIVVDDDGIGVSSSALRGNGLDNMIARAQALDRRVHDRTPPRRRYPTRLACAAAESVIATRFSGELRREHGRLGTATHSQLGKNVGHVVLDGLLGEVHLDAYLTVRHPGRDQIEESAFLVGELTEAIIYRRRVTEPVEYPARRRRVEQRFSAGDASNGISEVTSPDLLVYVTGRARHDCVDQRLVIRERCEHETLNLRH